MAYQTYKELRVWQEARDLAKDLMSAIELIEKEEKIEEATAMRKLLRIGFENLCGEPL